MASKHSFRRQQGHAPARGGSRRSAIRWGRVLAAAVVAVTVAVAAIVRLGGPARTPRDFELNRTSPLDAPSPRLPVEDDPRADGWTSEEFNQSASEQLARLKQLLLEPTAPPNGAGDLLAEDFATEPLRPELEEVFHDGIYTVRRAKKVAGGPANSTGLQIGLDGLRRASEGLARSIGFAAIHRASLKIFRLRDEGPWMDSTALFEASGVDPGRIVQVKSIWRIRWSKSSDFRAPKISRIAVEEYEETIAAGPHVPQFVECGPSVLGGDPCYRAQFLVGLDQWMEQLPRFAGIVRWGDQGGALGDINGDGLDDLYLCEPAGLPNRLFVRREDGTLRDIAHSAGVDFLDHSRAALLIDFDNDGDQDLIVALAPALVFLENVGDGRFVIRITREDIKDVHGLAAADFDGDRLIDVFACTYHGDENAPDVYPLPLPYHDATNGGRDRLLRNAGDWAIEDVTRRAGLDLDNNRWGLAASWEDYDDDGDPDLYLANDFGRNQFYRNDGGTFRDVAAAAGVEDVGSGMSVAWGDFDRDGRVDLYVSNMFSTAGGRITEQENFRRGSPRSKGVYQRMSAGNSLFRNIGTGEFRNESRAAAVDMARWAWGAAFADLNNDTWSDLVVTNGFITRQDERDL